MGKSQKITKEMTISEVIEKYPNTTSFFIDYGLHCISCPIAAGETIEGVAKVHQLDLEKFLIDLNKAIKK